MGAFSGLHARFASAFTPYASSGNRCWDKLYLIIDTRNWWPGKKVLVSPQWIERVSWSESKVFVNLARETVKQSPEYTETSLLTRDYETGLHRHYKRQGYWGDKPADTKHASPN